MKIISITEENFSQIDSQELLNPARYVEVENLVLAVGWEGYPQAVNLASILVDRLSVVAEKMPKELFAKYLFLLRVLKLFGLRALTDKEKQKFFSEGILDVFKSDLVNVHEQVDYTLKAYAYAPDILKSLRDSLITGLEKNSEILGKKNIKVTFNGEDRLVNPMVQNWLADYNSLFHTSSQIKKRGGYEQINYITGSSNARLLEKQDSAVLLKLIQFYDWLKFDPLLYNFREQGSPLWEEEIINVEKPEKFIPDDLASIIENIRSSDSSNGNGPEKSYISTEKLELPEEFQKQDSVVKTPPVTPTPPNVPKLKPMEEISNLASKPLTTSRPLVGGYKAAAAKGVSARGILSQSDDGDKGLKMSWQNPEPDIQAKQQEIDKKLEDLEKRTKGSK
ncbi:MAG: hypothetical protein HY918_02100 [Candidatus Doudnabacteria bacterium]|nr:hypothetical protein [Candidatus Doudnabacteria bacterium]